LLDDFERHVGLACQTLDRRIRICGAIYRMISWHRGYIFHCDSLPGTSFLGFFGYPTCHLLASVDQNATVGARPTELSGGLVPFELRRKFTHRLQRRANIRGGCGGRYSICPYSLDLA
jgi:hypothetical protein